MRCTTSYSLKGAVQYSISTERKASIARSGASSVERTFIQHVVDTILPRTKHKEAPLKDRYNRTIVMMKNMKTLTILDQKTWETRKNAIHLTTLERAKTAVTETYRFKIIDLRS
jgi:hypothetical protein